MAWSSGSEGEAESSMAQMLVMGIPQTWRAMVLQSSGNATMREGSGPPPASKASMEAMRKLDPQDLEPDQECPVCLVEIAGGGSEANAAREMPCKHRFHEGCINKWLGMHGSCPVCRFQMPIHEETANTVVEEWTTIIIYIIGEQEGEGMENND